MLISEIAKKNKQSNTITLTKKILFQSTPVGTSIFRNIKAEDKDAGVNGLVEYFIVESSNGTKSDDTLTSADGFGTFAISFPHQGQVSELFFQIKLIRKFHLN